jgi:glycosyltransferase involved in cell wall biosynthesis
MKPLEVDVVLATYNGSRFLQEQLDSIACQQYVKINLYVSDDGSADRTLDIIQDNAARFSRLEVLLGPRKGPAANFFSLLRHTSAEYVALADQDDIWHQNHLINSINDLAPLGSTPGMRFSSTNEFGLNAKERIWPRILKVPPIENLLVENQARGCTTVLNKNAVVLVNSYEPKAAVMHDWWILLVISLRGKVIYSPEPEVEYRIHDTNAIGLPKKRGFRALRSAIKGTWPPMLQAFELFESNKNNISNEIFLKLENFTSIPSLNFLKRASSTLFRPKRLRSNFFDELAVRVTLFLHKNTS